jgi:hypothetical protein
LEHARAPTFQPAHFGVETPLERFFDWEQGLKMRPAQLSPQCGDNLFIGESFRKLDHAAQVLFAKSTPKLHFQLCTQRGHNLLPILGALFPEDVLPDAAAHVPVQGRQRGVHGPGDPLAGLQNQLPHIRDQRDWLCGWQDRARSLCRFPRCHALRTAG